MKRTLILLALVAACTDDAVPIGPKLSVAQLRVELGPVECGLVDGRDVRVDNAGDEELVVAISTDIPNIAVQPELRVPAFGSRTFRILATIVRTTQAGTVTLVAGDQEAKIDVDLRGNGIPVTFDPAIVDFGNVLPNTTKELPLRVTLGEGATFAIDLALGPTSTPRFEVVGATATRLSATTPAATFTLRYHASAEPLRHDGTLPVTVQGAGSCTPSRIELVGVTVP